MLFNKKAYTIAEVVVAAGIFMVFAGAAFSLFSMGSGMFVSGSWKYNQQKEAERFFQILRERVEQASELVSIDLPNAKIDREGTNFVISSGTIDLPEGNKAAGRHYLAQFAVCKPHQIEMNGSQTSGLALCHGLVLVSNNESGLYDLCLRVDRRKDDGNYFSTAGDTCVNSAKYTNPEFNGNPVDFGLPSTVPTTYILRDVYSVSVNSHLAEAEVSAAETSGVASDTEIIPGVFVIEVGMRNPKHPNTKLEMSCKAKIDGGVKVID